MSQQQENIQVQDYCNELCVRRLNPLAICNLCNALADRRRFERLFLGGFLIRRVKMAKQTNKNITYKVDVGQKEHSDLTMTSLFNAHIAIINSERQTIWQRYNVMLLANSIIFGFLAKQDTLKIEEAIFGIFFGLALCCAWYILTASGWNLIEMSEEVARRFFWEGCDKELNPLEVQEVKYEEQTKGGWIYRMAIFIIFLFIIGYIFLGLDYFFLAKKYTITNPYAGVYGVLLYLSS